MSERVMVTGGSGFIAAHCILQLLADGYQVRTTVRSLDRNAAVLAMLETGGAELGDEQGPGPGEALEFAVADLLADAGWAEAVAGCDYVLHVASPFPAEIPKHEDDLIRPAREGAMRVLRAARDAGVKRVVQTSSFAAIGYGIPITGAPFCETDWTNPEGEGVSAYVKSKTLAERAAWEFMAREGGALELSVVNPVGVFGPVLGPDYSTSIQIVKRLMDGSMPGSPRLAFGVVDVRDVVDLHLRAMKDPAAKGERFLAVAGDFIRVQKIASILKERMGAAAGKVPTRELPDWMLRVLSVFVPPIRQVLPELGRQRNGTNEKARRVLGWSPRSSEEAIVATAESLVRLGLLPRG